jgi:hypothetical protein
MRSTLSTILALGLVVGCLAVLSLASRPVAGLPLQAPPQEGADGAKKDGAGDASKPYELIAPLLVLMEQADAVFYGLEEKLGKEKFKEIKNDALFLAEMGNLYTHAKDYREKKTWQDYCVKMKADLLKLSEAAAKKDGAQVKALWTAVEKNCDACHEEHRD